ncbi:hypothetical protein K439DRAFT_1154964 [Ramaria rubella]|nr:hypothetical protein K439DRAFT_1154964 [Ramaria rubella]
MTSEEIILHTFSRGEQPRSKIWSDTLKMTSWDTVTGLVIWRRSLLGPILTWSVSYCFFLFHLLYRVLQTTVDVPNDEGMFGDGEEFTLHRAFVFNVSYRSRMTVFYRGLADILGGGEDFLGLRELDIEAEFGLKSLSITKRLWKGKSNAEDHSAPDRCVPLCFSFARFLPSWIHR